MAVEYKHWEFSSQEQQKFQEWMDRIKTGHTGTQDVRNQRINFTPLTKPLSECTVTVVSTGGVHLKSDQAYDVANPHGDWSFREIPTDTDISDLAITHIHYNHVEAAGYIQAPGAILELPYRWRRFPVQEEPVYPGTSIGPRHPQVEAMGESLDELVRLAQGYKVYLEERLSQEKASASPIPGLAGTLQTHVDRVARLIEMLDTDALDQLREIYNPIATLELRAGGRFV